MPTITWLHLSDLHACNPRHGWDADRVTDTLVDDLRRLQSEHGLRPDLIFFTGDAAYGQIGKEPEKTVAGQLEEFARFLDAVRGAFDPAIELANVFLVPGNHDVNRDWKTPDQAEWLDRQESMDPVRSMIHEGGLQWRRYMERLSDYRTFLETRGFDHLLDDPDRLIYSTLREVGGRQIGIAGFNTAWSCCRNGERGRLWMAGKWQQGTLRRGLKGADFSISLLHHSPDWLVEYENPDFGRGLVQDFKFLLHGHEHRDWVLETADGYSVVAAGACYESSDSKHNGYNLVRLDPSKGEGEVWLRQFDGAGGGWIRRIVASKTDGRGVWPLRLPWLKASSVGSTTPEPPQEEANGREPEAEAIPLEAAPVSDLDRYLQRLRAQHRDLPLAGFETRVRLPIQIQEVYIPLRARVQHAVMERGHHQVGTLREMEALGLGEDSDREVAFDEALELACGHGLRGTVVLGDPGSGKTTLLKHFVLAATDPLIGPAALGLPAETVPVLVALRSLDDPAAGLMPAIEAAVAMVDPVLDAAEFTRRLMRQDKLLILVDGLDEVADEAERAAVSRWLQEALGHLPGSTFVVTSRYAGYKRDARLDGRFLELHVLDVEEEAARRFIHAWYLAVESQAELGRDEDVAARDAAQGADDLISKIFVAEDLRTLSLCQLAKNPLMLQILCLVHRDRQQLPKRRVELYRECVAVLLELWRRAKGMLLTFDAQEALRLLQPLAWHLHTTDRREAELEELLPRLEEPLRELGREPEDGRKLLAAIRDQSGVLVSLGQGAYGFLHLSFQEYLAALYVQDRHASEPEVLQHLASHFGEPWWREVILLSLGLNNPSLFEPLMASVLEQGLLHRDVALADDCLRDALAKSPRPFLQSLGAGLGEADERYHALRLLRALPGWETVAVGELDGRQLVEGLAHEDGDPQVRGMAIELLGGEKPMASQTGKGPAILEAGGRERIHEADGSVLVRVPRGIFLLGGKNKEHHVELSPFWIGKYPVTNAQYARFLEANPGQDKPGFWEDKSYNDPEQPVVGVRWLDAMAYSCWAGLMLPSEAQWEAAARGQDGRTYPWGDGEPTAELANYDGREGGPTPVGAYPKGAGPYGTLDQAGNVWEWCLDEFSGTAYKGRDGKHDPVLYDPKTQGKSSTVRVLRGGSWASEPRDLPAAFRYWFRAVSRYQHVGFRVVCGPAPEP